MVDNVKTLSIKCIFCREKFSVDVSGTAYNLYAFGESLIKDVLPDLTEHERSLIVSGLCGPCDKELWDTHNGN